MKRIITLFLAALLLLSLVACGGGNETPQRLDSTISEESEPQKSEISSSAQTETSESSETEFGDMLDPFQGEWEIGERSNYHRLIINGDTVNFLSYENLEKSSAVENVSTFYFGFDENGGLVVNNQYSQARYTLELGDSGQLTLNSLTGGKSEIYEKVSDSTDVPEKTLEPEIGMSELDVITSTWGAPEHKNKTTTANGESEQWVYENGYIYFENGKVTAIQER